MKKAIEEKVCDIRVSCQNDIDNIGSSPSILARGIGEEKPRFGDERKTLKAGEATVGETQKVSRSSAHKKRTTRTGANAAKASGTTATV
jgi:hypothetical protein